jgi:hypothetical protein
MNGLPPPAPWQDQVRRRLAGDFVVDPWGLDPEFHDTVVRLGRLRWDVDVEGAVHIPDEGPALLLIQRHVGLSEATVVATGVRLTTPRRVRTAGVPGVRWFEATMRRSGAAMAHPAEISGLLRDGHVVGLGLGVSLLSRRPGGVDPELVIPALAGDVPILPVATYGNEIGRRWTVQIGAPIELSHDGGRLAAVEHVERARDLVEAMQKARR